METDHETRMLEIGAWLDQIGKNREWLAEQVGVSVTTVNGWFSRASGRPIPLPTDRLINRLMQDTKLGEPRFSIPESNRILKAMETAGYVSFLDFARDSVKRRADRILNPVEEKPVAQVADEQKKYPNQR